MRKGFTLVEFVIAALLFAFMAMSLTTIYATAHKHMFQNYRQNKVKSDAAVAMKTVVSRLQEAGRIDLPLPGGSADFLALAANVDQTSGCYPVNPATPGMTAWHYFCHAPGVAPQCPLGNCLFYHTGPIQGGGICPNGPAWDAANGYPVAGNCGLNTRPGETVTLLSSFVQASPDIFSRPGGSLGNIMVNATLHILWDPWTQTGSTNFRATAKVIDTTLATSVRVIRSGQ